MNITKVIDDGIELQREIIVIGQKLNVYRKELEQIEELLKEAKQIKSQEQLVYIKEN